VTEPFLNPGDVGLVLEGVRGGRCSERVNAEPRNVQAGFPCRISHNPVVKGGRGEGLLQISGERIFDRPEQGAVQIVPMAGHVQVVIDPLQCPGMGRHVSELPTFSVDPEVGDTPPQVDVFHFEFSQLLTPNPVE